MPLQVEEKTSNDTIPLSSHLEGILFSDSFKFVGEHWVSPLTKAENHVSLLQLLHGDDWNLSQGNNLKKSSDERPHACPRCVRTYKFRTSLYRHLKFECGKAPGFQCPQCPYMTKQKAPMQRHIRNSHGMST